MEGHEFVAASPEAEPVSVPTTRLIRVPGGVPDLDAVAREVARKAAIANVPTILRLSTAVFLPGGKSQYHNCPGVQWKAEFASLEELVTFREELGDYIAGWFKARTSAAGNAQE